MIKIKDKKLFEYKFNTDKFESKFVDLYSVLLNKYKNKKITLLEIGIKKSHNPGMESLMLWRNYFTKARIIGIDILSPNNFPKIKEIEIYQCDCRDSNKINYVLLGNKINPTIVIDDGGHTSELHQKTLGEIFPFLKKDGIYFIEDLLLHDKSFQKTWAKWKITKENNTIKFLNDKKFSSHYLDKNKSNYLKNHIKKIKFALNKNIAIITKK